MLFVVCHSLSVCLSLCLSAVARACVSVFLARDSMLSALYAIARPSVRPSVRLSVCPSVRPSVCPSHGWISRKRLNVSSKFFHHLIGPTF